MKRIATALVAGLLTFTAATPLIASGRPETAAPQTLPNVIILIPDGMSVSGTTLARLYSGAPLALDPLATGLMSTWNGDGTIADSAPAGSALSAGWKSQTGNIASTGKVYILPGARVPAQGEELRPVATILEAAKLSGRATGIISTSEFMHATPADFSSHDPSRSNYDNLTEQIVYNGLDVILGGGIKYLKPETRKDKEDMAAVLKTRGYTLVGNTAELKAFQGKKLVGVFGKTDNHTALSYDMDRDPVREPALAEMTAKAIEVLSAQPKGFFLMVEGSKVDWAAHANDTVGIISDVLAFDRAVKVAVDFAKKQGNTLVIAVTDHGNSGISIGDRSTSTTYDKTPWTSFIDPLKRVKVTGEGFEAMLPSNRLEASSTVETHGPQVRALAQDWLGIGDLTNAEVESLLKAKAGQVNYVVGPIVAQRAKIGYTTNGHTGEDVVLYAYDPRGRLLGGLVDNTVVAQFMAQTLGVDLDATTERLFQDATAAFLAKGAQVVVDKTDAENPVLVVTKGSQKLEIPRNKSVAILNGQQVISDGVTVFNGTRWFVASNLIALIK